MSVPWSVNNLVSSALPGNQQMCIATGGSFSSGPDPDNPGKFVAKCVYSALEASGGVPGVLSSDAVVPIEVNDEDLDAIQRIAAAEVGHFGKYGKDQLTGGLAGVVDTIFNRVAHPGYPSNIRSVINQDRQFSPINGLAGWHELDAPDAEIADTVEVHVTARAAGSFSAIKGATNFLNPYHSSATALAEWGDFVKANPTAVWGSDDDKDVHYHGYPPHGSKPWPYLISFGGNSFTFDPTGTAAYVRPDTKTSLNGELANNIVAVCRAELKHFDHGAAKEGDDPQYKRVGEYWDVVGKSYNGQTMLIDEDGKEYNPAWSAVFVCYILKSAGAASFPPFMAHSRYFQHFVEQTDSNLYRAVSQQSETPGVGDILHYGREYAKRYDFAKAQAKFGEDGSYPSHSDIVVEVDLANNRVFTVGGNVSDSVKMKTVQLDENQRLQDRTENGRSYPWIGILQLR